MDSKRLKVKITILNYNSYVLQSLCVRGVRIDPNIDSIDTPPPLPPWSRACFIKWNVIKLNICFDDFISKKIVSVCCQYNIKFIS